MIGFNTKIITKGLKMNNYQQILLINNPVIRIEVEHKFGEGYEAILHNGGTRLGGVILGTSVDDAFIKAIHKIRGILASPIDVMLMQSQGLLTANQVTSNLLSQGITVGTINIY